MTHPPLPRSLKEQQLRELESYLAEIEARRKPERTAARFYDDPLGFIDNCVTFPERRGKPGEPSTPGGLTPYQREIIASVPTLKRVSVRGPHGLGKTTLASLVVLWFAITREMSSRTQGWPADWKIMTTAGSWTQLRSYLWPEIHKWADCINWEAVGRGPFSDRTELQQFNIRLLRGLASAVSPDKPELAEGLHADSVLYLYDEAKLLTPGTFESAEGAFAAAGEDSALEAYALAISTPGECAGPFYSMHRHDPEWSDWHPRHVTREEAIAAGRMSRSWAERRKELWGETSAVYQNRVLGEFCSDDERAIVPLAWAEAAVDRWREWDTKGRDDPGEPHIVGVDVASTGSDKSAAAIRWGNIITDVRVWHRADTMVTTGKVKGILDSDPYMKALVDVIGVGAGVYDRLREQGSRADAFDVRKKTGRRDVTGQFGFVRVRDAAWYNLRTLLDPARGATLALPPVDELLGDLTSLHFEHGSDGKVHVEEKSEMRKRLGRSPDMGDAVAAAMWETTESFLDVYGLVACPDEDKCGRAFAAEADGKRRTRCPFCRAPLEDETDREADAA